MFWIYSLLAHILLVPTLVFFWIHPKLRGGLKARLGLYSRDWPGRGSKPVIWFHGASAGDVLALQPLILEMREKLPASFLLVTTITNSGYTVAKSIQQVDACSYAPFDLPWVVKRSIQRIRPDLLVLECAEIWPAWLRAAKRHGCRVAVVNGRFSQKLLGKYHALYRLIGNPLNRVDLFCMQDDVHASNALSLGAEPKRVRVTGNTKMDACKPNARIDRTALSALAGELGLEDLFADENQSGLNKQPLVLVAGSTHDQEEQMLLDVFVRLRERFSNVRLVIAPRYIERAHRVAAMARERGLACGYRSKGAKEEPIVILDTIGELSSVYCLGCLVVVGGSFVPRGGHNILEPAACGKPVIFGPFMENNRSSLQLLLGRGGVQVLNAGQLESVLVELLADRRKREQLGASAKAAVSSTQGVSRTCSQALLGLLQA